MRFIPIAQGTSYDQYEAHELEIERQLNELPSGTLLQAVFVIGDVYNPVSGQMENPGQTIANFLNSRGVTWIMDTFGGKIARWPDEPLAEWDPYTQELIIRWTKNAAYLVIIRQAVVYAIAAAVAVTVTALILAWSVGYTTKEVSSFLSNPLVFIFGGLVISSYAYSLYTQQVLARGRDAT